MKMSVVPLTIMLVLVGCGKAEENTFYGYAEGRFRLIAPETSGRLVEVRVEEGSTVSEGEIIARLEDTIERAQLEQAKAQARAQLARVRDAAVGGREPEVQAAKDQLEQAQAAARAARDELERVRPLVAQNVLPRARLDSAEATMQEANARVAEMRERLTVVELPAREHTQQAIRAEAEAAEAAIAAAQQALDRQTIRAPAAGLVERLIRQEGELASPSQPIARFLVEGDMMGVMFVPEDVLATFRPGLELKAVCDSCLPGLTATVIRVAQEAEYTSPMIFSDKERKKLVYRVETRLGPDAPPTGTPMTFRR